MPQAALILAHQYPAQVSTLIRCLVKNEFDVFLHIDIRSKETYEQLLNEFNANKQITFISKRYPVYWGSFNQVRATLELMKCARKKENYTHYSLLSGQDLPIKSLGRFKEFLAENMNSEFLHWYKLPHYENHGTTGGMERMELYWLDVKPRLTYFRAKLTDLIQKLQKAIGHKRKLDFDVYSGSQWFTLTDKAVNYCLEYLEKNPGFLSHFKYSRCADEIFFQTLLLNSPLKDNIRNENLRYIDWHSGPEFPRVLRVADWEKMTSAADKFFGRKFDHLTDARVIEKLTTNN